MAKFEKGKSGNPAGRPKGTLDRRNQLRDMIISQQEKLAEKAVSLALEGSEAMLKLLLDRLLPAKPRDNPLSPMELKGTRAEQASQIIKKSHMGALTPNEAVALLKAIIIQDALVVHGELEQRLEAVEGKIKYKS